MWGVGVCVLEEVGIGIIGFWVNVLFVVFYIMLVGFG